MEFWHRIQLPDSSYTPGKLIHGPDGGDWPTTRFGMPDDLTDKAILDVGCADGFFSFEAEKRNAKTVVAIDLRPRESFLFCHKALNSNVIYDQSEDLSIPSGLYISDIVLCYGVLYHVKSPLIAMENLSNWTKEMCLLETAVSDYETTPGLEYRPNYDNDETNFFYPNSKWIHLAAKEVGFSKSEEIYREGPLGHTRATYRLTKGII